MANILIKLLVGDPVCRVTALSEIQYFTYAVESTAGVKLNLHSNSIV
jgi:hypothetical protein